VIAACFIVAYFLARFTFRGRNLIFLLFMAGLLIPIHALLVPIFLQFRTVGLLNTRVGLIIVYIAINMPVGVFLFESYVHTIPRELDEAAHLDGATTAWILSRVIFPLSAPIAFTTALLTILRSWNEFPLALVLIRSDALRTLPIGLANFQGTFFTEFTPLFAALVIVTSPVLLLYIFFNRRISRGMVAGAVKG
ncbi:MAG: carbohydrate ABC transporter permease, partial [Spirochaetales bacterium]|nr:carbohydrate ABC transporter permease [Spirochaetales bacterium]